MDESAHIFDRLHSLELPAQQAHYRTWWQGVLRTLGLAAAQLACILLNGEWSADGMFNVLAGVYAVLAGVCVVQPGLPAAVRRNATLLAFALVGQLFLAKYFQAPLILPMFIAVIWLGGLFLYTKNALELPASQPSPEQLHALRQLASAIQEAPLDARLLEFTSPAENYQRHWRLLLREHHAVLLEDVVDAIPLIVPRNYLRLRIKQRMRRQPDMLQGYIKTPGIYEIIQISAQSHTYFQAWETPSRDRGLWVPHNWRS